MDEKQQIRFTKITLHGVIAAPVGTEPLQALPVATTN
jgi:hypothetical protein